jgi:PAS domain S-box-containing protein
MYTVLYVDDEAGLLEIGKFFLEEDGQFIVDTITSAPAALALLETKVYDAIISDYHMPVMDGIEFLKIVRTSGNTIPFILFTGRGREEIVIQALNEGADFYLQKGGEPVSQFTELAHQIVHAVKRKRAEKELAISVEKYRRIVETTDEGIWQMDEKFETNFVNPKIAEILGYAPEEMIGRNIASFMTAEDMSDNSSRNEERRLGKSGRYERRFITKDGRIRWMQVSATPLMDPDGTFRGSFVMCSDITDRKTAGDEIARRNEDLQVAYEQLTATEEELRQNYDELAKSQELIKESERKYRNVVEDQTEFISRFLPDGTHIFANETYCRYFNMDRDKILGHRFRPKIPKGDRDLLEHYFASLTPDHPSDTIENRIIMPDGSLRWQWWSNRAIFDHSGKVTEYQAVGRDITEEKIAKIALQESEQRLSSIYNAVGDVIFQLAVEPDEEYRFTSVNPAFSRVTGLPTEQVIGRKVNEIISEPSLTKVLEKYRQAIKEKTIVHWEETSDYPTGQLTGDVSVVPIFEKTGICTHLIGSVHDITERKQAESELRVTYEQITASEEELRSQYNKLAQSEQQIRESEEKFRAIFDSTFHFTGMLTPEGIMIEANRTALEFAGVGLEDVVNRHFWETAWWKGDAARIRRLKEAIHKAAGGIFVRYETEFVGAGNSTMIVDFSLKPVFDSSGRIRLLIPEARDITKHKNAEDALRESEELLRLFIGHAPAALAMLDKELRYIAASSRWIADYHLGDRDLIGHLHYEIFPELTEKIKEVLRRGLAGEITSTNEDKFERLDGSVQWLAWEMRPWYTAGHEIGGVIIFSEDITRRKNAEMELQKSDEKYRQLFEISGDALFVSENVTGKIIEVNEAATRMYGYSRDELLAMCNSDLSTEPGKTLGIMAIDSEDRVKVPVRHHRKKDGTVFPVEIAVSFFTWNGRRVNIGSIRDITERKLAEDALREANKKLNLLSGITRHDINNQLLTARGFLKILQKKIPDPAYEKDFIRIEEAWGRIFSMIQFTKQYEQIGVSAPVWQDCRILVDTAVNDISLGNVLLKNDLPANAEVFADPLVVRVFYNLVDNAIRYGMKITQIHVFLQESGDGCCIICEDDGAGVPAEEKERIFERGFGKNTGMGLYLAREILSITGITIRETGKPGAGARFDIMVPGAVYRSADMQKNPGTS